MPPCLPCVCRSLGGIPILVELLGNPTPDIHKCACGALRNISFGKANEENKVAIKNAGGVPALIRLLRTTRDPDVRDKQALFLSFPSLPIPFPFSG